MDELLEENEEMELKSVIELAEKYQKETFSNYKVAYLHGKIKTKENLEIKIPRHKTYSYLLLN